MTMVTTRDHLTPAALDALMGVRRRPEPTSGPPPPRRRPPSGPPRPTSAREIRIAQAGIEAGFPVGRHGAELPECPYRLDERPRWLWYLGTRIGETAGREELKRVRASYRRGLESIDGPQPNAWGGTWGDDFNDDGMRG